MYEKHLQAARAFLNEASNSLSLAEAAVFEFEKKAEKLKPLAEQFDRTTEKLAVQTAELSATEAKLAAVKAAHAQFAKIVNG